MIYELAPACFGCNVISCSLYMYVIMPVWVTKSEMTSKVRVEGRWIGKEPWRAGMSKGYSNLLK